MYCDLFGVGVGLGSAESARSTASANTTMQMTTLVMTVSKQDEDYRRTMSRADRSVAHAPRLPVGKPGRCFASVAAASRLNSLWGSLTPAETRENREKFAITSTPSPARETRTLPNPLELE